MFEIPFNITFTNISFRVDYSGIQWCSPTEYNLQLNGDDILPLGPKSGYLDILSSFPSSLSFTADQDLRFQMETETSFTFAKELEIISRRVLRSSFTLESDRAIFIGHITFAEDIVPQSVWLNSIQYSFSGTNHSINPDITMNIGETFILEVYLAEDIYKQLEYYYNSLGSGAFDLYLSGTTSDPFFDDKTKDYNFFIQLPSDFYLAWMDLQFSDLNYLPDYTSNGSHDISDYGFYGPDISNEDVSWSQYWYQQNGLAYKMDEHGGSGYEDVYSEGFDSLTGEMTLDSYPSYYNNTYDFGDNLTMVNEFPNEYHEEDWYNWSINSNSTFSTTKYNVSGYYPATNNFMNDIIGETGTDIGFIDIDDSGSGTYVGLVESIDGHKKVLHFYDRGNPGACDIIHHLNDNKQSGTIEFWLRGTNTASWHNYFFEDSLGNNAFQIKVSLDHIYIRSGGAWHSVQAITDNVWYHIRIDFERTSNGYMSLSQNEFRIFIDDVEHGNYALENNNDVSQIHITTNTVQNIMDYYVDALAFSWDPYYEIGDNKYLASKDNITLTSELNNFTKSLIPSNSSFVMTNGTQVDNGTLGMLDDDYSTFNVSEVEGLYNATYSFTGETGETGTDIDFIDSETSYDGGSEVIAELDGHSEVLQHTDDATAGEDPDWSHNFDTNHNRGITEYWWRAENLANNPYPTIHWYEDATMCFRIRLTNANKIGTVNPPAGWDDFATFNNDQWYHIKVEWYSDNTFDIWLDNVLEVDGYSMESNQVTGINKIRYGTWGDTTESQWFDAWGENWDENYDIGGNNASTFAFGTYKGTYSFTTDIDNSDPAGWTVDETHGSIQIIADLGGHNKILDIHDTSNAGKPAAFYVDASTHNTDGDTIEWWMRTDDATFYSGIRFYDDGSHTTLGMRIRIESEQMDYEHSGGWTKAIDVVDNTWYHCKIVFDYTADTYDFYVDGVLIDSDIANSNDWTQFQEIILTGATGHLNYHHYYDAFGFSWDPNYDIGDNLLNNSVEVNFTTTINLGNDFNMHNYQLNYSSKTDIYQEVNMSVYNFNELRWDLINSSYNNQSFYESVFVFNSSHYNSTSDMLFRFEAVNSTSLFNIYLDLFNITLNWTSSVNIYTTLNKTLDFSFLNHYDTGFDDYQKLYNISIEFQYLFEEYLNFTSSMARFNNSYFADYSFFNELGLTEGDISFITGNDGDGDCEVSVIREQDNHDYVLDFNDNNNAGQGIWFSNFLDTSSGIVSFYIYFESVTEDTTVSLLDDSNYGPRLEWQDDGKLYYDDGSSDHEIESYSANQWYYIKINFTTATDTFDLWIDGDLKGEDLGFDDSSVDGIDQFYIMSDVAEEYHFYMDAIDYSWEDDWAECHYNFQFNSTDVDDFDLIFNITNGLIEIRDMNYTITFECLNLYGGNEIYQYFKIDPVFSIDYLQKTRGNWILNWSMNFTESSDYLIYNFTNSINSSLFLYRIGVECEDGWLIYNFTTNTSFSSDLTFNITDFLNNNSKTTFLDYYFEVYLAGNPSEVSFDDMVLWDFDSDFYNVNDCYIDDTLLGSHQNLTIYWNATDRYISNVEINQTLNSQTNVIFNETLINNTLQSVSFWNTTSGLYNLTLQFFDTHGNWELWAVNYTVIPSISLAAGYENPVFINTNNTVNFNVLSSAPIIEIYYDNSTDYIQEYNNDTYPLYQYEFNFTINYPVQTVYNVSIKVIDEYNDTYWMNITNLCHIQRTTIMDIINLKSSYDQDASLNLTISLRDLYNQPIQGKPINYTIYDHNNITFVNTSSTTDALGEIDIDILMNITWTEGFYHINCSFNDTAESYMGAWKLMSFEVLPIIQVVTNSSLVNLTVNGVNVSNNLLTINKTEANSFDLLIDHAGSLTFDLLIENASLYINKTVDYSDYVNYDFSFTQKSSPFTFITFNSANLTNIPDNFTYYYFDGTQSTNYNYDINSDSLEILSLIGSTYVNLDTFSVQLRYLDNLRTRTQITNTPRTDTASVLVSELFLAELDYKYWYFVGDLDINEVNQMEHLRTGTIYSGNDFTIENDKYKFDLSQKTEINDLFEAILDVNPNYNLTYEVLENNGTYSEVRVNYMSDIILENVTIVIPLRSDGVYMDNWSLSAIQSSQTYNLEIPNISFSTSVQSFTINGNSSIPTANISQYINEGAFTITESNYQTLSEYYNVYLEYERYSESWIVPTDEGWELDGVHYGTNYYGVGEGYFVCSGFDSSITSSYLRVKTNPISSIERVQGSGYVEYTIVCNYPAYDVNLEFYIQSEENIKLNAISTPSEFLTHIKLYDLDGVHYYQVIDFNLAQGTNVIRIEFEKLVIWDAAWLLIPAGAALLGFVIIYYGITKPESLKKLQFWKKKDKKRKRK
ncbi:MAG: hypothetical protein U9Q73_01960 [Nanoarchaeota archaeon]|nr:hypothetical protein [Nanoarchaeota archaeon]